MLNIQVIKEEVGAGKDLYDIRMTATGEFRHLLAWALERMGAQGRAPNLTDIKYIEKLLKYQ
jgi:hypothetical protein